MVMVMVGARNRLQPATCYDSTATGSSTVVGHDKLVTWSDKVTNGL
jgi:hypothetical protein